MDTRLEGVDSRMVENLDFVTFRSSTNHIFALSTFIMGEISFRTQCVM